MGIYDTRVRLAEQLACEVNLGIVPPRRHDLSLKFGPTDVRGFWPKVWQWILARFALIFKIGRILRKLLVFWPWTSGRLRAQAVGLDMVFNMVFETVSEWGPGAVAWGLGGGACSLAQFDFTEALGIRHPLSKALLPSGRRNATSGKTPASVVHGFSSPL